ncbi:MAG: SpoIIE family protein phosphatase [Anaerolineales bacterium]|jgi:sigma-B regulation protein RsbU (phosphoserine phosphatase)
MLTLRDFSHLSELDEQFKQVLASDQGVILVAGWVPAQDAGFERDKSLLSSGRASIKEVLFNEYMQANPAARAVLITRDRSQPRRPKTFRGRVTTALVTNKRPYDYLIEAVASSKPDLIVVDELLPENAQSILQAATAGRLVLTQIDTLLCGAEVLAQLMEYPLDQLVLQGLAWIVTVERYARLCPACRQPEHSPEVKLQQLAAVFADLQPQVQQLQTAYRAAEAGVEFYLPAHCERCAETGRAGELMVFDVYHHNPESGASYLAASQLSRTAYLLKLAADGKVSLDDVLKYVVDQKRRLHYRLVASENSLGETTAALRRRVVELEAANLVLQQRTEQLISLENLSQLLIESDDLLGLAKKLTRRLESICGADYAVFYMLTRVNEDAAELEILGVHGWDQEIVGRVFPWQQVLSVLASGEPRPLTGLPPGLLLADAGRTTLESHASLRHGLLVPLVTRDGLIGLMAVQSTLRRAFTPGEMALLSTFANQTALALQRARLVQARIQKEQLEREMEVARQVQLALLPQTFPVIQGLRFAAYNRAARWVGGDFYDLFQLDDDHLGLVIGDASDKGMPAALYMALTRSLILAEASRSLAAETVLRSVNQHLRALGELRGFVTVFFAILEISSRRMNYASAGHDRPYLFRDGQLNLLMSEGMMLGMFSDENLLLTEASLTLMPGDRLVLYTDGVTDVTNPRGEWLSHQQFERILLDCLQEADKNKFCRQLISRLDQVRGAGDQFDDMTVLLLEVEK